MPKSKRNKQVELSKSKKKGLEGRKQLYNDVRSCIDTYTHLFIFSVNGMRNAKMKNVRHQWRHSRFFIGKNKVMAIALGRTPEEEYRPNLHKIGESLRGAKGLLFTNQSVDEVLSWFRSYSESDYARSGNIATEDVFLPEGPLLQFPHSLESYLRRLGLPTTLTKGVVHMVRDHVVCKAGDVLSPDTAKILKLLDYQMAEFQVKIECVWSQDGTFLDLKSDSKENLEKDGNDSTSIKASAATSKGPAVQESGDDEEMESDESNDDDALNKSDESDNEIDPVKKDKGSLKQVEKNPQAESDDEQIPTLVEITEPEKLSDQKSDDASKRDSMLKLTKEKVKKAAETTPKKYSPKMTRARAAASAKKKPKTPEEAKSVKRSTRSRAVYKDV